VSLDSLSSSLRTLVGGEEVKDINIPVYDAQGRKHILTGALVRTNADTQRDAKIARDFGAEGSGKASRTTRLTMLMSVVQSMQTNISIRILARGANPSGSISGP
jgi:hypothetical protein